MAVQTKERTMLVCELVNYFDVWGNAKDGFEINNLCKEGTVLIPENHTHKDIVQALKDVGFFKKHVRSNMIDVSDNGDGIMIEIEKRRDGKPVCRLEVKHKRIPVTGQDLKGKRVMLCKSALKPEYQSDEARTVLCTGGFGCDPNATGNAVYVQFESDGESAQFRRGQVECIIEEVR